MRFVQCGDKVINLDEIALIHIQLDRYRLHFKGDVSNKSNNYADVSRTAGKEILDVLASEIILEIDDDPIA